ncbi:MAG: hypothetical protein LBU86_06170 [Oscillospiraceae bacterium]|jgi:hypothetical protein|nr:hypothetical protein [Oscillospiraceae bacterium]
MNDLTALRDKLVRLLALELSGGCDVMAAWPEERVPPAGRPFLCAGIEGVALTPSGLLGFGSISRENPGLVTVTLRLDLYRPGSGADGLHRLYEELCGALLRNAPQIGLQEITCEPLCREEARRSWRLPVKAVLKAALTGPPSAGTVLEEGSITKLDIRRNDL